MVLDGKSLQEYYVNVGVPEGVVFLPTLFQIYVNDLSHNAICKFTNLWVILLSTLSVIMLLICYNR